MKKFIILLLGIINVRGAQPAFNNFESTQFDTNNNRIKYRADWTNELTVIHPATTNIGVVITNFTDYGTISLPAKVTLLSLGTNQLDMSLQSTWLLNSPTNDESQVILSLSAGKEQGQLAFITSQNGDESFTLPNNSEQYNVPGAFVYLQGTDWVGTTNRGIILQYVAPDWVEMARFDHQQAPFIGSGVPGEIAYWVTTNTLSSTNLTFQPAFTTGVGVTNISNVLSGNYSPGTSVTFTTNANGNVSIASTASGAPTNTLVSLSTPATANGIFYSSGTVGTNALAATGVTIGSATNLLISGYLTLGGTTNRYSDDGTRATYNGSPLVTFVYPVVVTDETTSISAGTNKIVFPAPFAFTLTNVRAFLTTAQASGSIFTVFVSESGTSVLSTPITIDNGEQSSKTAVTPPVISDTSIADDAPISISVSQVGNGSATGLKVELYGYQ